MNALRIAQDMYEVVARLRSEGRQIAFVSGNFNVLHPGHLRLLRFAFENSDHLVIGINPDDTPGVTVPAALRIENVSSIAMVGHAVLLTEPVADFIRTLKPDLVVKGKEYENDTNLEQGAVDSYGGKLLFSSGETQFSSTDLLRREYSEVNHTTIRKPRDYPSRHNFSISDLKADLAKFSGMRVLVIGDLIVDKYIDCDPIGMSQEDPTIVVTPIAESVFVGGAGIVSAHARGLGADVTFLSVCGEDATAKFAAEALEDYGVGTEMMVDPTRPTTLKQRFRASGKTLLRVNELRQHAIEHDLAERLISRAREHLKHVDLLLFSDFNYGCLPQIAVDAISEMAKARNVMMAADSQASSQYADISRFKDMHIITPTEREARLALRDFESGLPIIGTGLQEMARAQHVIVTLGTEGLFIHGKKDGGYLTDRLPAFNSSPKDVSGAGDSFFTCTSLAQCADIDIWRSIYLGSIAAACQVGRVGNTPLTCRDIIAEIDHPQEG